MEDFIFNEKLLNKYHNENERRIAREEGKTEGMAAQKAEDEKIIHEKDVEIEKMNSKLEQKDAELARLKALLQENK